MADADKTYQPGWNEPKHHHHHHHTGPNEKNRGLGGSLRMKDKQAYYGLLCVVIAALVFGAYKLIGMFVAEFRAMPNDDPTTEMNVDELDIRRVEKQEALMVSDSIAKTYQFDSTTIKKVQTESHHVYRPPRKEDKWYITQREWKKIWADYKIMRWERKQAKEQKKEQKKESRKAKEESQSKEE